MSTHSTNEELTRQIKKLEEEAAACKQQFIAAQTKLACYKIILNASPDLLVLKDKSFVYQTVNAAFCDFLGRTETDILGKSDFDLFPLAEAEMYRRDDIKILETGQSQIQDEIVTGMEGEKILQVAKVPVLDETGAPEGVFCTVTDITERKRDEERIRESEQKFRAIFEGTGEGIAVADTATKKILFANPAYRIMYGYTTEELAGLGIENLHPSDAIEHVIAEFEAQARGEKLLASLLPCLRKDGSIFYADVKSTPVDIGDRKIVVGFFTDITERKRAEEALRTLSLRQKAILEAVPDIIVEVDHDKVYTWANPAGYEFFGDDVIGKEAAFYFEGDQITYDLVEPLFKGEENIIYLESWQRRKDGAKRLLAWWCRVLKDENGNVTGALSTARDITESKQAAEALKLHTAIMETVAEGIFLIGVDDNIIKWTNLKFEEMFGYGPGEMVGIHVDRVNAPTEKTPTETRISIVDLLLKHGEWHGEIKSIRKDGTPFWCHIHVSLFDHPEYGRVMVSAHTDIDAHKKAELEREKLEAHLLQTRKMEAIGVLAGGIAHDFNNILTVILGNINLALFDQDLKEDTKKILLDSEKASVRAKHLTQQLLTFAKGGEPVKETSSIGSVIRDSADFVLHGNKVACQYDIPKDLWLVDIDKGQMSQVIQNIVLNASQAMAEGGVIKVCCENVSSTKEYDSPLLQKGKFVKIVIQDSGIGIPANVIDKIFDPYFSTKQTGSGLGLAITHSIISKHGGHVSVESSPGVGSTFSFSLPVSDQPEPGRQNEIAQYKVSSPAKILLMDDEEMVRNVAKAMLNKLGHEVILAVDGAEAVRFYQEALNSDTPITLVIMDLTIPGGMGGKEAVHEVLKIDARARVIVASGYANDPVLANCNEYGFRAAIVKPFRLQDLARAISQVLD